MNKQQLLTLIDQAARDGRTKLDLSDKGLTELPPKIGRLTGLTKLNLGNPILDAENENCFAELPPEIWQLTNLQSLKLSGTQLSALPPEIGQQVRRFITQSVPFRVRNRLEHNLVH